MLKAPPSVIDDATFLLARFDVATLDIASAPAVTAFEFCNLLLLLIFDIVIAID